MRYPKIIFFTTVILIGLVALVYYKYFSYTTNRDIILFEEQEEHKRKPLDPGGVTIPHSSSLIYEKLNPSNYIVGNVNFLSEPEEPLELVFKSNLEDVVVSDSIDDILSKLDFNEEDKTIENDISINQPLGNDLNHDINSLNTHSSSTNKSITNQEISDLKITKISGQNNKLHIFNTSTADSGYKIQLSSAWSEKEAKAEWNKIQLRHIKYLKNTKLIVKKVKINNNRIIYLIMAGNYSSLNQAKLVCKKLVLSKQNCIVTK